MTVRRRSSGSHDPDGDLGPGRRARWMVSCGYDLPQHERDSWFVLDHEEIEVQYSAYEDT